jgi:CxxC motif-containing protein (DUF1111 family)
MTSLALALLPALLALLPALLAATDPGPRSDATTAGSPISGLTAREDSLFRAGKEAFEATDSVSGAPDEDGNPTDAGLGPRFNLDGCAGCHSQPASGGTSPRVNPQVAVATKLGARNAIPWFVAPSGPVREARFKRRPDGSDDGGVTDLFVITGRVDAAGCDIAQPDFGPAGDPLSGKGGDPNLIFRIPTPIFGGGLIEGIADSTILANKASQPLRKAAHGIRGREARSNRGGSGGRASANRNGNDGTITRFGWKAQNKSLLLFAAEAYNVEQGVTNELFPNERDETPSCMVNPVMESGSAFDPDPAIALPDIVKFAAFMRFLAPPEPAPETPSSARGRARFDAIGCALCHTPSLTTGRTANAALSGKPVNLFSDLLLHGMGKGLADGIAQGSAVGDEFRTAPLWGLGHRLFFLHDGRTNDVVQAILAHRSAGSEASASVDDFDALTDAAQQDLLNFLRSL